MTVGASQCRILHLLKGKAVKKSKYLQLVINTFKYWSEDNVSRLAAALSYYTAFSLAPFLVICISLAGIILGNKESAQAQILQDVSNVVGSGSADQIHIMIDHIGAPTSNIWATIIGVVLLLFGATGVFTQLQDGLNTIWGVKLHSNRSYMTLLKIRILSFGMVFGIASVFLMSIIVSTMITSWSNYINAVIPGLQIIWLISDFLLSFLFTALLFAMIFQSLPAVLIQWSNVWIGAIVTSFLFAIGKFFLVILLSKIDVNTVYGTAGSLIVILIWVYYSSQILFLGAIFTKLYSQSHGYKIVAKQEYKVERK
jgi:membrane protein